MGGAVFVSLAPARTTVVYDTFWRFAAERQRIFFARLHGQAAPWTHDPILQRHRFTNAYRASDRVSQYLIRHVIYDGPQEPKELFFRVVLFKLFNRIETWQLLQRKLGAVRYETYRYLDYDRLLSRAIEAGSAIYSAAYIMAPGHKAFGVKRKHQAHLKLLELMISEDLPGRLVDCKRMKQAFELLKAYPLVGDFLAYQLVTDLNYSELTRFSEAEFTIPGPGARDGIRKCFSSYGGLSEVDLIHLVTDRQELEFERLGIEFSSLWGRRLQLIDIQNLFCEVDKYARVKHPEMSGSSGRTRIKQRFRHNPEPIRYFYPPKWKLSTEISTYKQGLGCRAG